MDLAMSILWYGLIWFLSNYYDLSFDVLYCSMQNGYSDALLVISLLAFEIGI